ncbi:PKD repeat-containing protein [Marivirga sericea]|uniref:PKD repeat-containing protein n=1 Tax=Marivirga sericea TaxID=1028 RepID=A0A1X7I3B1_9BACT|nr:PKD domain-containing protein [Marivirga sericea]SMG08495.1 PKD repeat-containing protein [Marivirga sericea]
MKSISFKFWTIFLFSIIAVAYQSLGQIQAEKTSGCLPLVVEFEINAYDFQSVIWQTEDGQSSTAEEPTFIFEESGEWQVTADLTLESGEVVQLTCETPISVYEKPQVDFSVDDEVFCIGESILFTNLTDNADSFIWSFGDGNQSTQENPTYQYEEAGIYTVTLTAKVEGACQEMKVLENAVEVKEAAAVTISSSRNAQCLSDDESLLFTLEGNVSDVQWNFGDGNTKIGKTVEYLYAAVGEYTVEVNYLNEFGCLVNDQLNTVIAVEELQAPAVKASETSVCLGENITLSAEHPSQNGFEWEINGQNYQGKNITFIPEVQGDITVVLTYTNSAGCSISAVENALFSVQEVQPITIDYASFTGCEPFNFLASNTTAGASSYAWKVNGKTIQGKDLNYTFEKNGNYKVIAITKYETGCEVEKELVDRIQVYKRNTEIKVSEWQGCAPFNTEFVILNGGATDVKWYLDEQQISGDKVDFQFEYPGIYYPKVSYINDKGCTVDYEFETPITVLDRSIPLDEPEVIESCTFTEVQFNGAMGYDFWEWNFGDGHSSTKQNPTHSYSDPGIYEVSLTTNNKNSCKTTIATYNLIKIPDLDVETDFTVSKGEECGYFSVSLEADLEDWQNISWFYNESLLGTDNQLNVSFISLGDVGISYSIGSGGECTKTKAIMIPNPWSDCENPEIEEDAEVKTGDSPIGKFQFSSCNAPYSIDLLNPLPSVSSFEWRFEDGEKHSKESFTKVFNEAGEHRIGYWAKVNKDSVIWVEDYITVTINQSDIDFEYEARKVCEGFEIFVSPENPEFENYEWKLNNNEIELSASGSFVIEREGLHAISLSASGQNNCATTKIKNIFIGNRENQFISPKTLCLGEDLSVEHNLHGFQDIRWDMGNGELIDDFDAPYVYSSSGEYQIKAIATDFEGCESVFELPHKLSIKNPTPEFTANKTTGCGETVIKFRNQSEGATSWLWDFGNGASSTEENPRIKFLPGTYSVTLSSSNGNCSQTITKSDFIVIQELTSEFSFEYNQPCLPVEVQFTDKSVNAVSWFWDFGDGNTSTLQNPLHTFHELPKSKVTLTVENDKGCKVTEEKAMSFIFIASFTSDIEKVCLGNSVQFSALNNDAVSWKWDFGDGTTSTEKNPSHFYKSEGIYDVKLIADNEEGCADMVVKEQFIQVFPAEADFELAESLASSCVPVQVSFKDLSTGAKSYFWDFGDGTTSKVANPIHVYNKVGEFDVSLVITNELGCQDTLIKEQLVKVSGPQTAFEIEEKVICLPQKAKFTDKSVSAVKWKWVFGDGNTSLEQNPEHLYQAPGIYTVTLIAENDQGCEQFFQMEDVKVLPTPTVDFKMDISGECFPVELKLTNESTDLLKPSYLWEFGDGQTSTDANPTILIEKTGTFEVSLTVKNDEGCPVSYTHKNQVFVRDTVEHKEADLTQILVENNQVNFQLEPYQYNNISHYNVYRDSPTGYRLLQKIDLEGRANQRIIYDDKSCRPQDMSHEYVFQAVSFCDDTVSRDLLTVFNTILLQPEINEEHQKQINWNKSKGFAIDNQRIFRKPKGEGQWQEIAVVKTDAVQYQDVEDLCPGLYEYRVAAFEKNTLRSISNYVEIEVIDKIYEEQVAKIQNTTVMETGEVFTEWSIPEAGKGKITAFEIYRSENGGEFQYFDSVEPHEQYYIDDESDTDNNTYKYQVKVINDCSIDTESSAESNTVLLQKDVQFRKYELSWNAFEGWKEGVKKYVIQRLNEKGEWETVEEVSSDRHKMIIKDTQD